MKFWRVIRNANGVSVESSMHWQRWGTVLVIVPPVILIILKGAPWLVGLLAGVVGLIALWEYYRIVFDKHSPAVPMLYPLWGYIHSLALLAVAMCNNYAAMVAVLTTNWLGAAVFSIRRFKTSPDAPQVVIKQAFGLLYIALPLAFALLLYNLDQGPRWFLFVLAVVAAGDTGAFYVGSRWGRHKLAPAVSPKKSIEGSLGGLAANLVVGVLLGRLFLSSLALGPCLLLCLAIGISGQVGDLFESEFKRAAGVKDSGRILPGHGGILDRIDALLFAVPIAYLLKGYLL